MTCIRLLHFFGIVELVSSVEKYRYSSVSVYQNGRKKHLKFPGICGIDIQQARGNQVFKVCRVLIQDV